MGILDQLPHLAEAKIRSATVDAYGGMKETFTTVFTDKPCWVQSSTEGTAVELGREGFRVTAKVFFTENPKLTKEHILLITNPNGGADPPQELEVHSQMDPDGTVGLGVFWRVLVGRRTTDS